MKRGKYFMKYSTHLAERSLARYEAPMTSVVFRDTIKWTVLGSLELETWISTGIYTLMDPNPKSIIYILQVFEETIKQFRTPSPTP